MTPIQELHENMLDDLLIDLDVDEYEKIFVQQIQNSDEDYTSPQIDHYSDLYRRFMDTMGEEDLDEDKRNEVIRRFEQISLTILTALNNKFHLDIDEERIGETDGYFYGYVLACYRFFIIDLQSNIIQLMISYLGRHMNDLYTQFSALDQKKDVVTMSNKRTMSPKLAILAANIYDVTDYIFSLLDESTIMDYMEEGDVVVLSIREMMKKGLLPGEFVVPIADIYKQNVDLKARVCLKVTLAMRDGKIHEEPAEDSNEETNNIEEEA